MRTGAARSLAAVIAAAFFASALAGCSFESGTGFIEIKTIPAPLPPQTSLILNSEKLEPIAKGQSVLRMKVGAHKLEISAPGAPTAYLCDLLVKKDRMTSVTVSVLDRPPRCQCRTAGDGPNASRTCVS